MLSVSDALAKVLGQFKPLGPETVALEDAVGRVLAEPVRATLDLPPFTNSSMDGYAVRSADISQASARLPVTLVVAADIPAGIAPTITITPGTSARIMTGAFLPAGADAVVPMEATGLDRAAMDGRLPPTVTILESVAAGAYVRRAGEDVQAGDIVTPAGAALRAFDVGIVAAFGLGRVAVVRRPRVAVLSTGDELVDIEHTPGPGQIRDSNSYAVAALVRRYGGEPIRLGVAADRLEAVTEKLEAAVEARADVIISSAGVSVGAYDVVKAAVELGGSLDFWKVHMRPGKPLAFGQYHGIPYFGLPGNPVSAVVTFELFVRPALLRLGGRMKVEKPRVMAELIDSIHSDGRESYLRSVVTRFGDGYQARSVGGQGSNILSALVQANALIVVPAGVKEMRSGSMVETWILDWAEDGAL